MANERTPSSDDSQLSPEAVEHRSFGEARKGWDKTDVRAYLIKVASHLRTTQRQQAELEAQLRDAQRRAQSLDDLDDAELLRRFGETTAKLLSDAHVAAQEIRNNATREAEAIAAEVEAEIDSIRNATNNKIAQQLADADAERMRRINDADGIASSRIADAERRAAEIRRAAEADAARYASATLERCRELVFEAQGARERLLRDLARRGRIANAQVEQLKAGRERLLESYRNVRRTLDDVTDDLTRADAEARAAADDVATRLEGVAEITTNSLISDLGLVGEVDLPDDVEEMLKSWIDGDPADHPSSDGATALAQIVSISKGTPDGPHLRLVTDGDDIPADGGIDLTELATNASEQASQADAESSADENAPQMSAQADDAGNAAADKPAEGRKSRRDARAARAAAAASSATEAIVDLTKSMAPAPTAADDVIDVDAEQTSAVAIAPRPDIDDIAIDPTPSARVNVDALFARLRADRTEEAQRASQVLNGNESDVIDLAQTPEVVDVTSSGNSTADISSGNVIDRAVGDTSGEDESDSIQLDGSTIDIAETQSDDSDAMPEAPITPASPSTSKTTGSTATKPDMDSEIALVDPAIQVVAERASSRALETEPMSMGLTQLFAERDDALAPLIDRLSRALKRTLQDEQNDLLDALRLKKTAKKAEVMLPVLVTAAEHAEAYRTVAVKLLAEVAAAGRAFAAGTHKPMPGTTVEIADLADQLAITVSATLHDRLNAVLATAHDQQAQGATINERAVSEQISAVYREHKIGSIDEPATNAVYATFARASMSATSPDTIVRWVVDTVNAPCQIGDSIAMAGAVKLVELFSGGQLTVESCDNFRCMVVADELATR